MTGPRLHTYRRLWSGAIIVMLLAYAVGVVGSGLDRLADKGLISPQHAPFFARARAEQRAAHQAFAQHNMAGATTHARRALIHDPSAGQMAGLLGLAYLAQSHPTAAHYAFRVAAQAGWRDFATQQYWLDQALRNADQSVGQSAGQSADMTLAAQRFDAMLRIASNWPEAETYLDQLLAQPAGKSAFAARLTKQPPWLPRFMTPPPGTETTSLLQRAATSALAPAMGCEMAEHLVRRLLEAGLIEQARASWRHHCGHDVPTSQLADPSFHQLAQFGDALPFGWARHLAGDVSLQLEQHGGDTVLMATNHAPAMRSILSQMVYLEPGHYRLKIKLAGQSEGAARHVLAGSLSCKQQVERPAPDAATIFMVDETCPQALFSLWLIPSSPAISIRTVELVRIN